jgi:hypothetical protein
MRGLKQRKTEIKRILLNKTDGVCARCGRPITLEKTTIEHYVPKYLIYRALRLNCYHYLSQLYNHFRNSVDKCLFCGLYSLASQKGVAST